jgi:cytochrome c oxidase subunit 2
VVHSWFLSDRGVKFDCVPGRSTRHVYYLDTIGDIRGQCAEVCGRFHHHMPIFVVGVTWGDFLVWWSVRSFLLRADLLSFSVKDTSEYSEYCLAKF